MTAANEPRFGRMIPAMVTPFDENLELDLDQVRAFGSPPCRRRKRCPYR